MRRGLRAYERRSVVVNTVDGQTFLGVLRRLYHDGLALSDASSVTRSGKTRLGGEVVIPRENVSFWQVSAPALPTEDGE